MVFESTIGDEFSEFDLDISKQDLSFVDTKNLKRCIVSNKQRRSSISNRYIRRSQRRDLLGSKNV